jgi:uncharacterized damage-inducible protein DinB
LPERMYFDLTRSPASSRHSSSTPAKPPAADKQTAVRLLAQSFEYVIEVLPQITAEQLKRTWHIRSWKDRTDPDGRAMLMNMFVHTAHHRAQCEVYMPAKGIKPPEYQF